SDAPSISELHPFPTRRSSDLALDATDVERLEHVAELLVFRHHMAQSRIQSGYELQGLRNLLLHAQVHLKHELFAELRDRRLTLRSEEHTSELQSQSNLVCRLL